MGKRWQKVRFWGRGRRKTLRRQGAQDGNCGRRGEETIVHGVQKVEKDSRKGRVQIHQIKVNKGDWESTT